MRGMIWNGLVVVEDDLGVHVDRPGVDKPQVMVGQFTIVNCGSSEERLMLQCGSLNMSWYTAVGDGRHRHQLETVTCVR